MKKLIPLLLGLVGLFAGGGVGYVLRPDAKTDHAAETPAPDDEHAEAKPHKADALAPAEATADHGDGHGEDGHASATEFVKLNNQFVVPVIEGERVVALVILSLTVAVTTGSREAVFATEPKLRDSFLQVLFDHANAGGFDGAFTQTGRMAQLRKALLEPARVVLGDAVKDVLITDIVRQDG